MVLTVRYNLSKPSLIFDDAGNNADDAPNAPIVTYSTDDLSFQIFVHLPW